jgi:hypothetical protein
MTRINVRKHSGRKKEAKMNYGMVTGGLSFTRIEDKVPIIVIIV